MTELDDKEQAAATPNGTRCYAENPYIMGERVDITEGVQALYDLVIGSMDWGSGFWTAEDAAPVSVIAHACGFANVAEVDAYIEARNKERQRGPLGNDWHPFHADDSELDDFQKAHIGESGWAPGGVHEHVLSSRGRCMWPQCKFGHEPPATTPGAFHYVVKASEPGVVYRVEGDPV